MSSTRILQGKDYFDKHISFYMNKEHGIRNKYHSHDFIEISYVMNGIGTHFIDNREYEVSKGDLFIINNYTPHYFKSKTNKKDEFTVYNCIFWPEFLDNTLDSKGEFEQVAKAWVYSSFLTDDITSSKITFKGLDAINLERTLQNMYIEFHQKEKGYVGMLKAYILQFFCIIFRYYEKTKYCETKFFDQQKDMVDNIINYLNNHYNTSIQLKDLSKQLFTSKSTLCRTFKECTGMTIIEYIQKIRMNHAAHLLLSTTNKVIDIANTVGYGDLKYFNQVFKKIIGQTPSDYRKEKNNYNQT